MKKTLLILLLGASITSKAQINSLTTNGTTGPATLVSDVLNIPQYSNLFNADGTLTTNRTINLSGKSLTLSDFNPTLRFAPSAYSGNYVTSLGSLSGAGHLILGNDAFNYIQAGTTSAGGSLSIYTNSTNSAGTAPNGNLSMTFAANGNVNANKNLTVTGNFNVIGTTSFTGGLQMGSASGGYILSANSSGTNGQWTSFVNSGGRGFIGLEGSTSGGLLLGDNPYAMAILTEGNRDISFGTQNNEKLRLNFNGMLEGKSDYSASYNSNSYVQKAYTDSHYASLSTNTWSGTQTVQTTNQQLSLNYDVANRAALSVNSTGKLAISPTGGMTSIAGTLGIGTDDTHGHSLAVNGGILATAVKVLVHAEWPDYVFDKSYDLPSLKSLRTYIEKNKHLPDFPSALEISKTGLDVGEINLQLTKKVEELTLYMIKQSDETQKLKENHRRKIAEQDARIALLEKALLKITSSN